jgi:hypothetical protein
MVIKEDEMGGSYRTHGRDKKCVQNFSTELEGKRQLRRPEDNIKMYHKEEGWTGSIWLRVVTSGGLL